MNSFCGERIPNRGTSNREGVSWAGVCQSGKAQLGRAGHGRTWGFTVAGMRESL